MEVLSHIIENEFTNNTSKVADFVYALMVIKFTVHMMEYLPDTKQSILPRHQKSMN